jgi:hypothetical protein
MNYVYEKLYKHIKLKKRITSLCREMKDYLTAEELDVVYRHFNSQKPSKRINKEFLDNKCFIGRAYWWEYHSGNKELIDEFTKQRKLFIFKMIKITTKK